MATPRKSTPRSTTPAKKASPRSTSKSTSQRSTTKSSSQRSTTKGSSERGTAKSTAKRSTPAKRTPDRASQNGQAEAPKSLRTIAVSAARELAQLIGQAPEGIVGVEKRDDGWLVQVEVVESRRIPETTDILAVYEVDVDNDGTVTGYRRRDRYVRGRIQE
jgi:DNA mismatch repair ATPase MutL